jgi:K+-sensing histidine kinase KdpD
VTALDRLLNRIARDLAAVPAGRRPRERGETLQPGERARIPIGRRVAAYAVAVVLPTAAAAAMIPIRADHGRAAVVALVLPVLLVAVLGAVGPAIAAALCAALAYDFFLTEPYYHLRIDDPDEIVAAVALAAVGVVVGVLNTRLVHVATRDAARRRQIVHLVDFMGIAAQSRTEEQLAAAACEHIAAVLNLRECRWRPGYHGASGPVLLSDGNIMGFVTSLNPDRATLPNVLEVPANAGATELGRFILMPTPGHVSSHEERRTAAAIAALFTAAVLRLPRGHPENG